MARLHGFYTTRNLVNDTFRIEAEEEENGQWYGYDSLQFPSKGAHITTPAGYEDSVEGAYQYAEKIFGITERA